MTARRITDTSAARGPWRPRTAEAATSAPGGVYRESRSAPTPEHRLTGPCAHCGRPGVELPVCECGHSVMVHELNRRWQRTRCEAGAGLGGCTCKRFTEEAT